MSRKPKPPVSGCYGIKANGKDAGSRHRWINGRCKFCHRWKEDVYDRRS